MEVQMRSSDFWYGMPYDIFWFSFVQQRMLHKLTKKYPDLRLGKLYFQAASLHVYKKHWNNILKAEFPKFYAPGNDYQMPVWDQQCEDRLQDWLYWEFSTRKQCQSFGEKLPNVEQIMALRDLKLPPFLETLGSFLTNKIVSRYPEPRDRVFLNEANEEALKSTCIDRKVGAVIQSEYGAIFKGHNEVLRCNKQCSDKDNRVCETIHAEINAVNACAMANDKPKRIWVTLYPCRPCMLELLRHNPDIEVIVAGFSHKGSGGTVTLLDPAFIESKDIL